MTRSVSDPDFKYTPSHNPYWEKLMHPPAELQGLAYADQHTETHRGDWIHQFPATRNQTLSNKPMLHVEVGCNAGHVCLEWAKLNPEELYIGVDWKFKQIYRLAEKAGDAEVKNLLAFRANAERLPLMFAPGEIDYLHMFFPDPWPKKAQMKNRTASEEWLKRIAPLLSGRGYFHLKTDHAAYFDFIRENLEKLKDTYEVIEETRHLHEHNPNAHLLKIPAVTLFERLFIKDGLPIHSIKIRHKT
ncbi:MAG: methyltransferase domain-containing protein [Bdellovibrionales bacterium]|nr:methyltransferase domain-containing protein [Oligoflexia bacterium]